MRNRDDRKRFRRLGDKVNGENLMVVVAFDVDDCLNTS